MPLMYPIKHVFRNWKLFTALLIGITLAATFCAAIGVKANLAAEQSLDKQISTVVTDIGFTADLNQSNLALAYNNITHVDGVKNVDTVASFNAPLSESTDNYTTQDYSQIYSFPDSSRIYAEWQNKPLDGIPENYTYIVAGSSLASKVKIGDNITTMISFPQPKYYNQSTVYVNLTVAGFAMLTDNGYSYLTNNNGVIFYGGSASGFVSTHSVFTGGLIDASSIGNYRSNSLIVDWNNTLTKLWKSTLDSSTVSITFLVTVDRQNLISPWNIQSSITNVNKISDTIQNQVMANYLTNGYVNNMLVNSLQNYQNNFNTMLTSFILVSIPVFFVAWYLGSTVSDVSFNIRRREIGLLSTKGLSSGQIQRMFLTEALIIGAIGGALGVVGGLILNQYYIGTVNLTNLFASEIFSPTIAVVTIIFGVILSLTSVFWSSRKASRIPAVDALRDYLAIENKSRFWSALHWVALILGSYKIVVLALGVNIQQVIYQGTSYSIGGFFLSAIAVPLVLFDGLMGLIGPILFLWGLCNILIRDSDKFQRAASKISSVMGELGALAAKNVRRNPARLAAIGFMIAFILAFSVQVTGQIASQQDYIVRNVHQNVAGPGSNIGADVVVRINNASRAQDIFNDILGNVTVISNATIQRLMTAQLSDSYSPMQIRTIDPDNFTAAAYYEPEWFTGASIPQMMTDLKNNNNTIILDRSVAKQLGLNLYDQVGIDFNSVARKLRIIGFFGPEPSDSSLPQQTYNGPGATKYVNPMFYSYVPANLFNMSEYSDVYKVESFTTYYLLKLDPGVNGTSVANQIQKVDSTEIVSVNSFDQQMQQTTAYNNVGTFTNQQTLDIQGLGILFAVLSASVGTALVAIISLKERSREATLMSVRGLSYRQLVWMFLTESMAIITFTVIIGVVVGVIIVYGSVASANASLYTVQLVNQRLIFPANAIETIGTYIVLVYASTIGAILVMTTQYVTKLEKMVRAR